MTNKIRTARYNALTFFPVALLVQFTKLGNVFWTCQFILQMSNTVSTQSPWPILFLIIMITSLGMLKEFLSDYKRKKADREVNEQQFNIVVDVEVEQMEEDPLKLVRKKSLSVKGADSKNYGYYSAEVLCQDIKVGDLLLLKDDIILPADCIVLRTFSGSGECQI